MLRQNDSIIRLLIFFELPVDRTGLYGTVITNWFFSHLLRRTRKNLYKYVLRWMQRSRFIPFIYFIIGARLYNVDTKQVRRRGKLKNGIAPNNGKRWGGQNNNKNKLSRRRRSSGVGCFGKNVFRRGGRGPWRRCRWRIVNQI